VTNEGADFKKIIERGGLRGKVAEYVIQLWSDYFHYCSTANAAKEEKAGLGLSDTRRERLDEEHDEAVAKAESLEPIIVSLYDLVTE
jgi:hypothetical protein